MLLRKIRDRAAKIAVVGLGHVGLTTAVAFARVGFMVIGIDVDEEIVISVSTGKNHLSNSGIDELIRATVGKGLLKATLSYSDGVRCSDVVIICVPTPINHKNKPDLSYLGDACRNVALNMDKGKLIIVESTVPSGTIKGFVVPLLEKLSNLKCGLDFYLSYCPERMAPGEALKEFIENTRIVGGYDEQSTQLTAEFFKAAVKGSILITDFATAEVAKLAENTFRYVNIAFANEFALICECLGVDVKEVIKLANTHPRVNIHFPGSGVGGSCLPKDPYLLIHPARVKGFKSFIIEASRKVNESMPLHVVNMVVKGSHEVGKSIKRTRIAVLGTAYKADVDDSKFSPAESIISELKRLGASVVTYDPYCRESFGAEKAESIRDAIKGADFIVIVTDHTIFRSLNLSELRVLMKNKSVIVDGRRVIDSKEAKSLGFIYYGLGLGGESG